MVGDGGSIGLILKDANGESFDVYLSRAFRLDNPPLEETENLMFIMPSLTLHKEGTVHFKIPKYGKQEKTIIRILDNCIKSTVKTKTNDRAFSIAYKIKNTLIGRN